MTRSWDDATFGGGGGSEIAGLESTCSGCGEHLTGDATLHLGQEARTLLEEALRLTNEASVTEIIRRALQELVERHRFLTWVAEHEDDSSERSGNA